jgi:putative transposase
VMKTSYQVSERRACTAMRLPRSTIRHKSMADPQTALRMRLRDLAMSRVGYGYRRLHILIEREGWHVNHKRVYRLCREEGLAMKRRPPRRRKACLKRNLGPLATEKNECWSLESRHFGLLASGEADGQRFYRVLQRPVPAGMPQRALVPKLG